MRRNATPTKVEQNETNKVFQVIVEGNIGSGKTTFLDIFSNSSGGNQPERRPFIVPEPIEAWRNVNGQNVFQLLAEDTKRWCFTFQSYVLLTMAKVSVLMIWKNHVSDVYFRFQQNHALMPPSGSGLKLMERSLFSARHCFVENLYRTKQLQPIEYHILDRWYRTLVSDVTVDLIIYLRTDPEVVYDRIRARARPEESRLTREYLKALHELHEAWLVRHEFGQPAGEARVVTIDANVPLEQIVSVYKDKTSTILAQHDHSFHRHV